ncbi:MAG: hypothetical protein ACKN81_08105 [Pirellulaceae bacterium]
MSQQRIISSKVAVRIVAGLCLGVTLLGTGCTSILNEKAKGPLDNLDFTQLKREGYPVGVAAASVAMANDPEAAPSVILQVNKGKTHMERIPLPSDRPLFVADLLKDAQLVEKVGRIQVDVYRPTGPNQPPVRMRVDLDSKGRNVMEGQNYSLRPGDRIVVSPNRKTSLDRFMDRMVPFAKR